MLHRNIAPECGPTFLPTPPNSHICTNVAQPLFICTSILQAVPAQPKSKPLSQNQIIPSTLCPHISAAQFFLHWMTPFGLTKLAELNTHLPPLIITCQRVVLVR